MADKVARCGVTKEKGHLYYLGKDGNVWASKMARGSDKGGNAKKVADTNVTREKGWLDNLRVGIGTKEFSDWLHQ